jgi:hypothetical protein
MLVSKRKSRRDIIPTRPRDPIFTAQRIALSSTHIPQHVVAPSISRIVRIQNALTNAVPSVSLGFLDVSVQDGTDYSVGVIRYQTCRISQVRVYADNSYTGSVSTSPLGIIVTDINTGYQLSDRPTTGSRLAAVGLRFPFTVRQGVELCVSTTQLVTVECDQTIPVGFDFIVTTDFSVEFYA